MKSIIRLQDRDLKFLHMLNKFEIMTTKQIKKIFFSSIEKTTMLRRLRLLEENKYIKQGAILDNYSRTWQLGTKSNLVISDPKIYEFNNRNTILHDSLLTDLRIKFEDLGLGKEWVTGNEIKTKSTAKEYSRSQIIPDGIMIESIHGEFKTVAIELELTIKSLSRYKDLFHNYKLNSNINHVWYFVKDEAALKFFIKLDSDYRQLLGKFWFSLIDEVSNKNDFRVYCCDYKKWLGVNELGFNLFKIPAHPDTQGVSTLVDTKNQNAIDANSSESQIFEEKNLLSVSSLSALDHTPPTSVDCGQERRGLEEDMK